MSQPKRKAGKKKPPRAKPERRPLDAAAFEDLCNHIALGKSLRAWAKRAGHDHAVVVRWIRRDAERTKLYREARQMQADSHIDQLIELADEKVPTDIDGRTDSAAVNDKRLRIDTRKWIASKYHPAMYGERVGVDVNANLNTLPPDQIMQRVIALFAEHGLRVVPETGNGPDAAR